MELHENVYFNISVLFIVDTSSTLKLMFLLLIVSALMITWVAVLLPLFLLLLLFLFIYLFIYLFSFLFIYFLIFSVASTVILIFVVVVVIATVALLLVSSLPFVCVWVLLLLI